MANIKTATFGCYSVTKDENNKITVSKDGQVCDNTKAALREIAEQCGFSFENEWTTQQAGAKLIAFLSETVPASPKQETQKAVAEKKEEPKVEGSKADIAGARVRVYGKAQNRTALGIMHAYMVMYPQSTLEDLQKAFPDSLNPDSGVKKNFVYAEDKGTDANWNGFFKAEDELLACGDKKKVSVVSMWTKPSFERLVAWAKQYGIVVAEFEAAGKGGEKGGFRLEYLNGYVPPKPKKGVPAWIWIVVALLILGLLAALFFKKEPEPKIVEKVVEVEKVVVVHDTLFVKEIEEIEKNFNAAEFVKGKADLSEDAKFVLHDLAKAMQKHPEVKLRLEGHTSAEGDADFNQKLSESRAQTAVTFLIEHENIAADRLEAIGFGSSKLKNAEDPNAAENRRTEFVVVEE